jgi:Zn-dependent metalloprotease
MSDRSHTCNCSIVPPHILEAIILNGSAEQRLAAQQTLALTEQMRAFRVSETTRLAGATSIAPPVQTAGPAHKNRRIYNTSHSTTLPGTSVRTEGQAATGDVTVNEAYDGFGATFDLYWNVFQRNSIDDAGMDMIGTVHYGNLYNNAFWNSSQMVFGDGDGTLFNRFTIAIDVMGHELTHGVTEKTAKLVYANQPGALNESMSDVFGSLVKQRTLGQTAAAADWLIGAGLLAAGVNGVALRSMKAPGTAYNDPVLGKDPQPDHMSRYNPTTSDNGGVHINSGIPNKAFYLAAVALGGNAWTRAGDIWYKTLTDSRLKPTAQFQDFANLTVENANRIYGSAVSNVIVQAWQQVGINVVRTFGGVQFTGTLQANQTARWFTFNWPAYWHVVWTVVPTTIKPGAPEVRWKIQVERASNDFITYWINVTNETNVPITFEGRYNVLG